ncbi:hypothetical protein B0T21DRAFT_448661 [Apiosordaria backusii]|uniref:Uncharacterized protein n=1 Tax=Apiosordaria backusii TaxID=314023 RepID=A0AA40EM69_9PEZI|nr:hypothetical protein B0T21DRAFT_448661 [Apiosordaria backusii]
MTNDSLIQTANPAPSYHHEHISGTPREDDLESEINAFRCNTIDYLANYLSTREASAHDSLHHQANGSSVSNNITDIAKAPITTNKFIALIAAHDQLQMHLVPLRNIPHHILNKAWFRLLRSAFYLASTLLLKLSLPLITTTPVLTTILSTLLASTSVFATYRATLYFLLRSKSKAVDQVKTRLDEESAYFKSHNNTNNLSGFEKRWLLTADDLLSLGAKLQEWSIEDDERQQLMSSHRQPPITTSGSDNGGWTSGWAWVECRSFLRELVRISEVFHFEELLAYANDAIITRVAETIQIGADRESYRLPPHLRRNDGPRTREQIELSRYAESFLKAEDVEVVYQKSMLHRAVFREVGCHIGAYNFIRDGNHE